MRLQSWPNKKLKPVPYLPIFSLAEIAEKLGLSRRQLQGHMSRSRIVLPKKILRPSDKCDYYEFEEFKHWWDAYSKTQKRKGD